MYNNSDTSGISRKADKILKDLDVFGTLRMDNMPWHTSQSCNIDGYNMYDVIIASIHAAQNQVSVTILSLQT